jgi:multidrug transporter EmrE-like cation transporter
VPQAILLAIAITTEVAGSLLLKATRGFTRPLPGVLGVLAFIGTAVMLGALLKRLDVSLVYAIWAGCGTAAAAVFGVLVFREPVTGLRVLGIVLVIVGVVVLNRSAAS